MDDRGSGVRLEVTCLSEERERKRNGEREMGYLMYKWEIACTVARTGNKWASGMELERGKRHHTDHTRA